MLAAGRDKHMGMINYKRKILPVGFIVLWCLYISMKIEGPIKTSGTKKTSKSKGKKNLGDDSFDSMIGAGEDGAEVTAEAKVSTPAPIGALGSLLAIQEDGRGGSPEANKRAKERADEILDQLDNLKMGILRGELPKASLQELSRTISSHRDNNIDEQLSEILNEIDLRAQVELAKLNRKD